MTAVFLFLNILSVCVFSFICIEINAERNFCGRSTNGLDILCFLVLCGVDNSFFFLFCCDLG